MRVGLIGCLIAILLILVVVGMWFVGLRNSFVTLDENVNQSWAQVESQYQRRYDLIPNLVQTVQGAANFEKSTLEAVVSARARVGQVQIGCRSPYALSTRDTGGQYLCTRSHGAGYAACSRVYG